MKSNYWIGLFIAFITSTTINAAVDYQNYKSLKSAGSFPSVFLNKASDEYSKKIKSVDQKGYKKRAEKDFHLRASFGLHNVLYNGRILFGDPLTEYVNKVADVVLKNDPGLRNKLSFFVHKSSVVNAFCFPDGVILINVGLLTQLEDESQLAMIIAHEVTHYVEQHGLSQTIRTEELKRGVGDYKDLSSESLELEYYSFSREHEEEADLDGLARMKKTEYDLSGLEDVFNMLKYSYLPYDEIKFDLSIFEPRGNDFPSEYYLPEDEIKSIDLGDENENEKSTHPSAESRKEAVLTQMLDFDNTNKKLFIVGEKEFDEVIKIARFELCEIYLNTAQYEKAVYNAYLNLLKYPEKKYNELVMAKSLYALSRYANDGMIWEIKQDYSEVEGATQELYYFFNTLSNEEFTGITISYILKIYDRYKDEDILKEMFEGLVNDMVVIDDKNYEWFKNVKSQAEIKKEKVKINFKQLSEEEINELSKLDKIKYRKQLSEFNLDTASTSEIQFQQYALGQYKNSQFVIDAFKRAKEEKDKNDAIPYDEREKKLSFDQKYKNGLGINNLLIIDPFCNLGYYDNDAKSLTKNESKSVDYDQRIQNIAKKLKMDVSIIDDKLMKTNVDEYNTFCQLKAFLKERAIHLTNQVGLINFSKSDLNYVSEKYNTEHIAFMGVSGRRYGYGRNGWFLTFGFINPFLGAYGLTSLMSHNYKTAHYFLVLDIKTGKFETGYLHNFYLKPNTSVLNATVYDVLYHTKKKSKK